MNIHCFDEAYCTPGGMGQDFTTTYRDQLTNSKALDPAVFTFDERFERLYRDAQDKAVRNKRQQSAKVGHLCSYMIVGVTNTLYMLFRLCIRT